jgi:hypothetical protein
MANPAPKSSNPPNAGEDPVIQDLPQKLETDLEARMRDMLTSEGIERPPERRPSLPPAPAQASPSQQGLVAARFELEGRGREAAKMVRLVDRHRQQFDAAEQDLEAMHERLRGLMPVVQGAATALKTATRACQQGDEVHDLADLFQRNSAVLDELEAVAGNLNAQLLWVRSSWDQYAKVILASQRLRAEGGRG